MAFGFLSLSRDLKIKNYGYTEGFDILKRHLHVFLQKLLFQLSIGDQQTPQERQEEFVSYLAFHGITLADIQP